MRGKQAKLLRKRFRAEEGRDPEPALFDIKGSVTAYDEERAYKKKNKKHD